MWNLSVLLLLFVSSLSVIRSDRDWDYVVFTQCWPAAVCRMLLESNSTQACAFPRDHKAWSIHGIWPSISGSKGPQFCNQTWLFDPVEIKPIESEMKQSWTNIIKDNPIDFLWAHEWNKHGTCAAVIEPLNSQIKYFSTGLKWLQKYTMSNILSEANIYPSNSKKHSHTDIYHAIKNKIGVDPKIKCIHFNKKQYLLELIICFTRSLEITDCKYEEYERHNDNNDVELITNCGPEGIVYLL